MRQRLAEAYTRCAVRALAAGLPMACTVNPFAPESPPVLTGSQVLKIAADVTGISIADMISHRRGHFISLARGFAAWLIRQRLGRSYMQIGHLMNKTGGAIEDGIRATERKLADDWPMIVAWRDRAAEKLSKIDTRGRLKPPTGPV